MKELVIIGEVVRAFGNKGEVKVALLTDIPDRFSKLDKVLILKKGSSPFSMEIDRVRYLGSQWVILRLKDFSFEDACNIVGSKICIPKEERPRLNNGRFWVDEIIGLRVYTLDGRFLGRVVDVFRTGANDVYVVEGDILIPATREVIQKIDLHNTKMIIQPLEGLI